jgi:hypothetical protein
MISDASIYFCWVSYLSLAQLAWEKGFDVVVVVVMIYDACCLNVVYIQIEYNSTKCE